MLSLLISPVDVLVTSCCWYTCLANLVAPGFGIRLSVYVKRSSSLYGSIENIGRERSAKGVAEREGAGEGSGGVQGAMVV